MAQKIAPNLSEITPAEREVMRVIWAQKATTSNFVIDTLSDKMNWKPATIKTLLGRLVKKNWLVTEKDKNYFIYTATVNESQALNDEIGQLLGSTCTTKVDDLIIQVIMQAKLDDNMLNHIQASLINKVTVEQVACECIPGQCDCVH